MDLEQLKAITRDTQIVGYEIRGKQPRVHVYRIVDGPLGKKSIKQKTLRTKKQANEYLGKIING